MAVVTAERAIEAARQLGEEVDALVVELGNSIVAAGVEPKAEAALLRQALRFRGAVESYKHKIGIR